MVGMWGQWGLFSGLKTWSKQPVAPALKIKVKGRGGTASDWSRGFWKQAGSVMAESLTSCATLARYFFNCMYKMGMII